MAFSEVVDEDAMPCRLHRDANSSSVSVVLLATLMYARANVHQRRLHHPEAYDNRQI